MEAGGLISYVAPDRRARGHPTFRTPSPIETMHGSDDEDAPSSTQPRTAPWVFSEPPPISPTSIGREWSMEQYICFVYRNDPVSSRCPINPLRLTFIRFGFALQW